MSSHTQVKLKLTDDPEILSALVRNGALKDDGDGKGQYLVRQSDAFEYRFYFGTEIVVPEPVANSLYRQSGVLIGDALSGTQQPGLVKVESWELGAQEPSRKKSKSFCSICETEQGSIKKLVAHIAEFHSEEEEEKSGSEN